MAAQFDSLSTSNHKSTWKARVEKTFKYDKTLDRILQLKQVSYKSLLSLFSKPKFKANQDLYNYYFYIPFESEKPTLLELAHNDALHNGRDRMGVNIHVRGFTWYSLTNDCINYISSCFTCPHTTMPKKSPTVQQIVATKLNRERYQFTKLQSSK